MGDNYGINVSGGRLEGSAIAAGPGARAVSYGAPPAPAQEPLERMASPYKERNVFVIHGRDEQARMAVFDLLRRMGLAPLEWETLVHETASAGPHLLDVIGRALTMAQAVVVLMTPDDVVRLHPDLGGDDDGETGCQARPNVLFEAGMAFGVNPRRTLLLQAGRMRPFSDVAGLNYVRLDGTPTSVQKLRLRLESAGCELLKTGVDYIDPALLRDLAAYTRRPPR